MKEELIIAGFGGQGVLSPGKILASRAIRSAKTSRYMSSTLPKRLPKGETPAFSTRLSSAVI